MKQEIQEMLLIVFCSVLLSGVVFFYLQRKFIFLTLQSEVEQLRTKKRKLMKEINDIKLQTAQYSSIHRINQLLLKGGTSTKFVENKIITLKIPRRPFSHMQNKIEKTNKNSDQITQYEYSPADDTIIETKERKQK